MTWLTVVTPVIKAQIEANVLAAAANPAFLADWVDDRQPYVHPDVQAEVLLEVTTIRNIAQESTWAEVGADLVKTVGGHRIVTLNVKCQSDNHVPANWGLEFLERLSQRLEKQSVSDALGAVNCGIIDLGDIQNIRNVKVDKRVLSCASLDVFLSVAFDDTDGAEIVDYFDHCDLTGALVNPAGAVYPSGVNPVDVVIPPGI
jgi:hypothetical protein